MAPVPHVLAFLFSRSQQDENSVSDLAVSSLEVDSRSTKDAAWSPNNNNILISTLHPDDVSARALSPMAAHDLSKRVVALQARDDLNNNYRPGEGSQSPDKFSGPGFLVLFALLGTGMVVASIWFFFWAKNGGFVPIQNEDWEDYKSTVLRRKGPDGKTLSNATKSTRLGGGSVVHGQDYMREKSIAATVIGRDEKGRKGIRAKRGFAKTHSVWGDDDYMTESWGTATVSDGMTEVRTEYTGAGNDHSKRYRDRDIHQYKREKPARVGGLNRVADGSHYDHTNSERSDAYTDTSSNSHRKERSTRHHARSAHDDAERRAKIEAHKMERRWKKEAEDAAAAMARENGEAPPPPKRSSAPSSKPSGHKQRRESRSSSPKKRDFSYQNGPASETLSTAYTASESGYTAIKSERTASYYDAYRPKNVASDDYESDVGSRRPRQSSPRKGGRSHGGYRRGADSDLD
jgi:hypothetical protein